MFKPLVGPVNSKILDIFVFSNIIANLFVIVAPVRAKQSNLDLLFMMNFLFVVGTLFFGVLTYKVFPRKKRRTERHRSSVQSLQKMLKFCSISSFLGVISILFDRVYFRGISYSEGLRAARYQWLDSGSGTIFGIVGNLFAPFAYFGIFLLAYFRRDLENMSNKGFVLFLWASVLAHAAINGGRSNLLLAAVIALAGFILGEKKRSSIVNRSGGLLHILVFAVALAYVIHIIQSSADLGDIDIGEMTYLGLNELYGVPDEAFFAEKKSDLNYIVLYIFSYLYHGQWTAQIAFDLTERPGFHSLVSTPTLFLESMGILDVTKIKPEFSDTGAFLSLPGVFYYDFGWVGLVFLCAILGSILGICMYFLNGARNVGVFKMALIVSVFMMLVFSPILPAYGFAYFTFIIFAFVFSYVIGRLFLGQTLQF